MQRFLRYPFLSQFGETTMSLRSKIEETNAIYSQAKKDGDVDTLVNGFTEDAIVMFHGSPPLKGRTEIRAFYKKYYSDGANESLEVLDVEQCGDLALVCGAYNEDGNTGKYQEVQRQCDDGAWRIKRLCVQDDY